MLKVNRARFQEPDHIRQSDHLSHPGTRRLQSCFTRARRRPVSGARPASDSMQSTVQDSTGFAVFREDDEVKGKIRTPRP